MKRNIFFSLIIVAFLATSALISHPVTATPLIKKSSLNLGNIDQAYAQYAAIDQALTQDDALAAQKAASELVDALKNIKDAENAVKLADAIQASKDINQQRKSFAALTVAMHAIFKTDKPEKMLYIHYCPMAKAYWMDENKAVNNPYLGKKMPTCGKTVGMVM